MNGNGDVLVTNRPDHDITWILYLLAFNPDKMAEKARNIQAS